MPVNSVVLKNEKTQQTKLTVMQEKKEEGHFGLPCAVGEQTISAQAPQFG